MKNLENYQLSAISYSEVIKTNRLTDEFIIYWDQLANN